MILFIYYNLKNTSRCQVEKPVKGQELVLSSFYHHARP